MVRIGDDRPEHAVFRYNEIAVSLAAHDAGLSPALLHHEPGALIFDYLTDAVSLDANDLRQDANRVHLTSLLGQCHLDLPSHLEVPGPMFWVFHLNRRYARIIMQHGGRMAPAITRLMALNDELETEIGPIQPVFCHNDLVAANIFDDGERYWLVDWEFGGEYFRRRRTILASRLGVWRLERRFVRPGQPGRQPGPRSRGGGSYAAPLPAS